MKRDENPVKRTGISKKRYINRPSQATEKAPTARLKKRRAANSRTGAFPNPSARKGKNTWPGGYAIVDNVSGKTIAILLNQGAAIEYAHALANYHNRQYRIESRKIHPTVWKHTPFSASDKEMSAVGRKRNYLTYY